MNATGATEWPPVLHRTNGFTLGSLSTDFRLRSWTTDDGLPHNTVNCLLQTHDGYLWIGTRNGLVRFDGFKLTRYDLRNTPALGHPNILTLAEHPPGHLWIGTQAGLVHRSQYGFTAAPLSPEPLAVRSISARSAGGVWLATDRGLMRFENGAAVDYPAYPGMDRGGQPVNQTPYGGIHVVIEDNSGTLWIGDDRRLLKLPPNRPDVEVVLTFDSQAGITSGDASHLVLDDDGGLWCANAGGWLRHRAGQTEFFSAEIHGLRGWLNVVGRDGQGGVWLADAAGGLTRWHNHHFTHYWSPTGSSSGHAKCLLADRDGNVWVGTHDGLNRLQPRCLVTFTTEDGLPHDRTWSIDEAPDGSVWIATDAGLSQYANGVFITRTAATEAVGEPPDWNCFQTVLATRDGTIWAGNRHHLWQLQSNTLVPVGCEVDGQTRPLGVQSLYEDHHGALWVGTASNLFRLREGQWDCFGPEIQSSENARNPRSSPDILGVLEDAEGNIWVATPAGLHCWNGERWSSFSAVDGLPAAPVNPFQADPDGTVWCGSAEGLIRCKQGRFFRFNTLHGLPENRVFTALEDDFGWFWFNGPVGLQRVRKQDLHAVADGQTNRVVCVQHGDADGDGSVEPTSRVWPTGCKTRDGRLWFPSSDGVMVVNPRAFTNHAVPPPVFIEQVVADGEVLYGEGAANASASTLDFKLGAGRAHTLVIRYTATSFISPENIRFHYKLDGHDAGWLEDHANLRAATYQHLGPGAYRFRVRAFNSHGVPSADEAVVAVSVAPYFFATWTFYLLCAGVMMGISGGFYQARRRGLRRIRELEQQHARDLERTRLAQDMHDGLGADLTKIAMLADLAQRVPAEAAPLPQLERIGSLARGLVDGISELVWATNPRHDTLDSLAAYLREHAAELFESTSLRCRFDFPKAIPPLPISGETRRHLFLAVKETLNNIIKHANATEVTLALKVAADRLEITISDNGCGLAFSNPQPAMRNPQSDGPQPAASSAPAVGRGNGLGNLCERLAALGGECHFSSAPGQGLRVQFRVPFKLQPASGGAR